MRKTPAGPEVKQEIEYSVNLERTIKIILE